MMTARFDSMRQAVTLLLFLLGASNAGGQSTDGHVAVLPCNSSSMTQLGWRVTDELHSSKKRVRMGEICLDCGDCQQGSQIFARKCEEGTAGGSQLWVMKAVKEGIVHFKSSASGLCLHVPGTEYTIFDYAMVYPCEPLIPGSIDDNFENNLEWNLNATTGVLQSNANGCCGDIFQRYPRCLAYVPSSRLSCSDEKLASRRYCNETLSPRERAIDLVAHMTLEEKAANMDSNNPGSDRLGIRPNSFSEVPGGNPLITL